MKTNLITHTDFPNAKRPAPLQAEDQFMNEHGTLGPRAMYACAMWLSEMAMRFAHTMQRSRAQKSLPKPEGP